MISSPPSSIIHHQRLPAFLPRLPASCFLLALPPPRPPSLLPSPAPPATETVVFPPLRMPQSPQPRLAPLH